MLWNVDLKASRDIPGDIRTFARKLVMGSVDLLPFAEREDLRNNSCLLVLLNSLCVFRWTCVTQSWVYREYSRGLRTQPCGAPMFRVMELEVNWPTFTTCGLAVRKS